MLAASLALLLLPQLVASRPSPQKRLVEFSALAFTQKEFDYVVVGGGTAGLIVAARLAEDPSVRVGVIEAGQNHVDDAKIAVPQGAGYLANPDYDWMMSSVPQPGAANRPLFISRGKMLGGCSGNNAMVFQRGHAEDYDAWRAFGNEDSWSFDGLLPYFKKAENRTEPGTLWYPGQEITQDFLDAHGHGGPIQVTYPNFATDVDVPMIEAVQNLGLPLNYNPDDGDNSGFPLLSRNVDLSGVRSYTAPQYFSPHAEDPNLVFLTGAHATKINFQNTTDGSVVASGVDFSVNGQNFTVNAGKEVILAAGAIKTPQILELSGVGNAELLTSLNITPIVDLPQVGENLQDHPLVITEYKIRDQYLTLDKLRNNATYANEALAQYEESHTGPLTFTPLIYGSIPIRSITNDSFMETYVSKIDALLASDNITAIQRVQYNFYRNVTVEAKAGTIGFTVVPQGNYAKPAEPGQGYAAVVPIAMHPYSRGSVHISSADPLAAPVIDMGFLSNELDKDILVEGIKFTRTWAATAPFSDLVEGPNAPGPEATTDADFLDYLENMVSVHNHASGTTAMASKEIGGVVDSRLKVYGLSNVRVVDAGVLPMLVSSAINPTVIAVAEKAADIIKADNGQTNQKREPKIKAPAMGVYGLPFKRDAKIEAPALGVYGLPFAKREGAKVFGAYGAW